MDRPGIDWRGGGDTNGERQHIKDAPKQTEIDKNHVLYNCRYLADIAFLPNPRPDLVRQISN